MAKRVFLVVLDSLGIGHAPDAKAFDDEGSNTLAAICSSRKYDYPNLSSLGLFNIDNLNDSRIDSYLKDKPFIVPKGSYGAVTEASYGKDSTIGHWEISGVYSCSPLPTYKEGFPAEIIDKLEQAFGRKIICNKPYSGTKVIEDYGEEHIKTGSLIVYTSADSVLQIAAHEEVVSIEELYSCCQKARQIMVGEHGVGRIIARPFVGTKGNFTRTSNRHDYSLEAPGTTMLDIISRKGHDVISVGKIKDLYAGRGITRAIPTKDNTDGIRITRELLDEDFNGLCMINLVDFDMKYGHRNDIDGYAKALKEYDESLGEFLSYMKEDDLLIITADHGCDPSTLSTDHSRERVPLLVYGSSYNVACNMGSLYGFGIVASIVYNALLSENGTIINHLPHELNSDNIFSYVDMTNLKVISTEEDIRSLVRKAIDNNAASVCVPPCYVRNAFDEARGRLNICTVIGFPNGYSTTSTKRFETIDAINNGASEIDMVINVAYVKSKRLEEVAEEIGILAKECHLRGAILKVIIETCYLTRSEKLALCHIVSLQGADFIKTSTGFGPQGATLEDVEFMSKTCQGGVLVKAAGGIHTEEEARNMIAKGASRIGASNIET